MDLELSEEIQEIMSNFYTNGQKIDFCESYDKLNDFIDHEWSNAQETTNGVLLLLLSNHMLSELGYTSPPKIIGKYRISEYPTFDKKKIWAARLKHKLDCGCDMPTDPASAWPKINGYTVNLIPHMWNHTTVISVPKLNEKWTEMTDTTVTFSVNYIYSYTNALITHFIVKEFDDSNLQKYTINIRYRISLEEEWNYLEAEKGDYHGPIFSHAETDKGLTFSNMFVFTIPEPFITIHKGKNCTPTYVDIKSNVENKTGVFLRGVARLLDPIVGDPNGVNETTLKPGPLRLPEYPVANIDDIYLQK